MCIRSLYGKPAHYHKSHTFADYVATAVTRTDAIIDSGLLIRFSFHVYTATPYEFTSNRNSRFNYLRMLSNEAIVIVKIYLHRFNVNAVRLSTYKKRYSWRFLRRWIVYILALFSAFTGSTNKCRALKWDRPMEPPIAHLQWLVNVVLSHWKSKFNHGMVHGIGN